MPDNTGMFMLLGLGALLFLGTTGRSRTVEVDDGKETVTEAIVTGSGVPAVIHSNAALNVKTTKPIIDQDADSITESSLKIQRQEQIAKQKLDWAANSAPPPTSVAISQGDVDALAIEEGIFFSDEFSDRPTSTAIPIWNNRYGWYWADPSGLPVGPGGKVWSPGDTSVNMGAPGTNIGRTLPPGWENTGGGSARLVTAAPNTINGKLIVSEPGATIVIGDEQRVYGPLSLVNGYGAVSGGGEDE